MSDNGTPAPAIPPGWYPDPADRTGKRWWDGQAWTAHVQAAEVRTIPTFVNGTPSAAAQPAYVPLQSGRAFAAAAAQQTGIAYTRAVWWICASPLWAIVSQVIIVSVVSVLGSVPVVPLAIGLTVLSLVFWGILIALAFADRAGLRHGGNATTASPWWTLLSPLAYLIARAIEVRRYEPGGWAPVVWWSIATVLSPLIGALAYFAVFGLIGA